MTGRILIFGGTSEGRHASDYLCELGADHIICVATEYGEEVLPPRPSRTVRTGRMDENEMAAFLGEESYDLVLDATHPYAEKVSENIRKAAKETGVPYLRYLRAGELSEESGGEGSFSSSSLCFADSAAEAADMLENKEGGIFLTTGSYELSDFADRISEKGRLFARILPSEEALSACRRAGLKGKQIYAMQGPFSEKLNEALLTETGAAYLVTKESGKEGGFSEKITAAINCGVTPVVIRRPKESGASWEEVKKRLDELAGAGKAKENRPLFICCAGLGPGSVRTLTEEVKEAILAADVLFGAKRLLSLAEEVLRDAFRPLPEEVPEYDAEKIKAYLAEHTNFTKAVILVSGDVGFFSGAGAVAEVFTGYEVNYLCGISSIQYFASKIPVRWEDGLLLSAHGRKIDLTRAVRENRKIFLLTGTGADTEKYLTDLLDHGLLKVKVTVGYCLSYPEEKIVSGTPKELLPVEKKGLSVMMVENQKAEKPVTPGIGDAAFLRGEVPMTKEEIRILSVSKLHLLEDSVVYDVGAGTGSVSVECARLVRGGSVYAIEKKDAAVDLIRKNAEQFGLSNVIPVRGTAPEAFDSLPVPTHAFLGGSGGAMKEILTALLIKNPKIRIVINTVTLESLTEAVQLLGDLRISDPEIVQVMVSKAQSAGSYRLMKAENSVYLISFGGEDT